MSRPELEIHNHFLEMAIRLARSSATSGINGPFGAVIVRDGKVISEGSNKVTDLNDPTAHAEIVVIRDACRKLGTFQLTGCILYCSCEPCPMCLGAIYWARPDAVYFSSSRDDAADAGFDDAFIYSEIKKEPSARRIPMYRIPISEATDVFQQWLANPAKKVY